MLPLAAVIGDPISHSKSPRLHGYWLKQFGIDGYYVPLHVPAEKLENTLKLLPSLGFRGINVTIPHKERVLEMAREVSSTAQRIGAANTLTFLDDGGFEADNTDSYGFLENLKHGAPDWDVSAGPAAVLGAGGASRAILDALLQAGCPEIRLSNRTAQRAEAIKDIVGKRIKIVAWGNEEALYKDVALAVNTTSLGMKGQDNFPFSLKGLDEKALATDLIYTPLQTPFLERASQLGCRTVDGLGMLLHQAVPGFQRWFGMRPEVTPELRALVLGS